MITAYHVAAISLILGFLSLTKSRMVFVVNWLELRAAKYK